MTFEQNILTILSGNVDCRSMLDEDEPTLCAEPQNISHLSKSRAKVMDLYF